MKKEKKPLDEPPKDEKEVLVDTTMRDHKRLMRRFNKQKLQNRINDIRRAHNYGGLSDDAFNE